MLVDPDVCGALWVWKPCLESQTTQGGVCVHVDFINIVLKSSSIKPLMNCFSKKSLSKTSEFAVPSEKPYTTKKSCYVVLEEISSHYDAEKL